MTWNYRLVEIKESTHLTLVGVCEVYYNKEGTPTSRTLNFVSLYGDCEGEVFEDYELIAEAFLKPILTEEDFKHEI